MKDKIEWNDAIRDLELLASIERNAIEAFIENNVEYYYKWIRAYFQKLCSIIIFDRSDYIARFKELQKLIWAADVNNDGQIDYEERVDHAVDLALAMEGLEQIYYELADLKVRANLSVGKKDPIALEKKKYFKTNYPVLDVEQ